MGYRYLIFDADHTLIDYTADEREALLRIFSEIGLKTTDEMLARAQYLSEFTWSEAGLYDVSSARIQKEYHRLYKTHLDLLFARAFEEFSCDFSPKRAGELLLKYLEYGRNKMDGATRTLAALSRKTGGKYKIYIATNGLSSIQRARLGDLSAYIEDIFISEEMGAIKPQKEFFTTLLQKTGASAKECLMIGDSLSSDVSGAINAGMDCCWLNHNKKPCKSGLTPTFEIEKLTDLLEIL